MKTLLRAKVFNSKMPTATHLKCENNQKLFLNLQLLILLVFLTLVDTLDFGPENNDFPTETYKDNLDEWYSRTKSKRKLL